MAAGVAAYKSGDYASAVCLFDVHLSKHADDKVALANRAAALGALGRHSEALHDAGRCIKLDWAWPKGHLRKAQALQGLGKKVEALEALLDASKVCVDPDRILLPMTLRLNAELGGYIAGLEGHIGDARRRDKEPFCVRCGVFLADLSRSGAGPCAGCGMVSYCCEDHRTNDVDHAEVCGILASIRQQQSAIVQIVMRWPDGQREDPGFELLARYPMGDNPLLTFLGVRPLGFAEVRRLQHWDAWFALPQFRRYFDDYREQHRRSLSTLAASATAIPAARDMAEQFTELILTGMRRTFTEAFTDPLTAFHALRAAGVLKDRRFFVRPQDDHAVTEIHVLGAEPWVELTSRFSFANVLWACFGQSSPHLHIHFVGPLLPPDPSQLDSHEEVRNTGGPGAVSSSCFSGTYQDFVRTAAYRQPDFMVAFHAGLYDPTYPWLPTVAHAVSRGIPLVVTCFNSRDCKETQHLLKTGSGLFGMLPRVVVDCSNPFASMSWSQRKPGENVVKARNTHVLVIHGGELGAAVPALATGVDGGLAAQLRQQLQLVKSVRNFESFCEDLRSLRAAGML